MPIRIVTDSTSDLPSETIEKYGITVIPAYINFNDKSYLDGVEITRKDFYSRLVAEKSPPTTSAPSIGSFIEAYHNLINNGADAILSIHPSETITSTYNVARLAAQAVGKFVVKTIDAGSLSMGTGLVVEAAAKMAQAGKSIEQVVVKVKDVASRTYTFAVLDTLTYLRRSGRVSRFKASLSNVLQIKPLINIHQNVINMEAIRTSKGALNRLIERLKSLGELEQLVVLHTNAPDKVNSLISKIAEIHPEITLPEPIDVTPLIGTHLGPEAVGFSAIVSSPNK